MGLGFGATLPVTTATRATHSSAAAVLTAVAAAVPPGAEAVALGDVFEEGEEGEGGGPETEGLLGLPPSRGQPPRDRALRQRDSLRGDAVVAGDAEKGVCCSGHLAPWGVHPPFPEGVHKDAKGAPTLSLFVCV